MRSRSTAMQQMPLFDIGGVSCIHCHCFLQTVHDLRERCPVRDGSHEVATIPDYYVLVKKTYPSTKPEIVTGAA